MTRVNAKSETIQMEDEINYKYYVYELVLLRHVQYIQISLLFDN
jgi:hypothetical protein